MKTKYYSPVSEIVKVVSANGICNETPHIDPGIGQMSGGLA